jgi:hypothetical protein
MKHFYRLKAKCTFLKVQLLTLRQGFEIDPLEKWGFYPWLTPWFGMESEKQKIATLLVKETRKLLSV